MTTIARSNRTHEMFTRNSVLLAGLLLVIRLAAASVLTAPTPATASPPLPVSVGPKAYVALFDDNEVAVVDTRANQVLAYIPGILGPRDLVASPDGRAIYVGSDGLPVVSVIDTSTDSIVATIRVGFGQRGLALSPDGRQLLVSLWTEDEVVSIDTATNQISGSIAVPGPERSAISPDGRRAYVISTDHGAPFLTVLDLATHARAGRIPIEAAPIALSFGPDGKRLYLTMADSASIQALDPDLKRIVARIVVRAGIRNSLPAQDGRSMLVVTRGAGALDVVDLARGVVSGTVMVGKMPTAVAVGRDNQTAYVTNEDSDDVSVVDLDSRTVVARISLGHGPREIVLQPRAATPPLHPSR